MKISVAFLITLVALNFVEAQEPLLLNDTPTAPHPVSSTLPSGQSFSRAPLPQQETFLINSMATVVATAHYLFTRHIYKDRHVNDFTKPLFHTDDRGIDYRSLNKRLYHESLMGVGGFLIPFLATQGLMRGSYTRFFQFNDDPIKFFSMIVTPSCFNILSALYDEVLSASEPGDSFTYSFLKSLAWDLLLVAPNAALAVSYAASLLL